jgi:hypothetical protein
MKIQNGYMLGFGLIAIAFSFAQATSQVKDRALIDRTPANTTYVNTGYAQPIPQIYTYDMIERSYTSAVYNETQLKLQQDAIQAQLTAAETKRAEVAATSPRLVMYPNNTYDTTISSLQNQITNYKMARSNNISNALVSMDFTYASIKYSLTRDQMLQAANERNHLVKLNGQIFSNINLPYDTSGLSGENQALIDMLRQQQLAQQTQGQPVAAAPATQVDTRTYAMPNEPNIQTIVPTAETNNAESGSTQIVPTPDPTFTESDYVPLAPVTTAI